MMKIGALGGLFIALPLIILQLWHFIAPGLYSHEKRFAIPFVLFGTFFFVVGAAFSHYVAFPWTLEVLPRLRERVHGVHAQVERRVLALGRRCSSASA